MTEARVLRVVTFQPSTSESAVDAALRERVLPALLRTPGAVEAWVGRHGAGDMERVIASTWSDPPDGDTEARALIGTELDGGSPAITSSTARSIAVRARFERNEPARLLRIFHGRALTGQLDAYVADARQGMEADAEINSGLLAFVLAPEPPDEFTTLSVWTDWPAVERATGGNIRRPSMTRVADRLADYRVVHYELLPGDVESDARP